MENNSIPNQQPVVPPPSHSFSKTFIIFLVLPLFVVVGVGGYMLGVNQNQIAQTQTVVQNKISPTPLPAKASAKVGVDETANWKMYSDLNGIFSVNYPAKWYENKTNKAVAMRRASKPSPLGVIGPSQADVIDSGSLSRKIILFQLENKPDEMSLDKYSYDPDVCKGDTIGYCESHTPYPIERKKITVDGKEAIWQITSAAPSGPSLEVFILKSPTEVIVIFTYPLNKEANDIDSEYKTILNQILSTFKFTQ